jgi:hypothetical protein
MVEEESRAPSLILSAFAYPRKKIKGEYIDSKASRSHGMFTHLLYYQVLMGGEWHSEIHESNWSYIEEKFR